MATSKEELIEKVERGIIDYVTDEYTLEVLGWAYFVEQAYEEKKPLDLRVVLSCDPESNYTAWCPVFIPGGEWTKDPESYAHRMACQAVEFFLENQYEPHGIVADNVTDYVFFEEWGD